MKLSEEQILSLAPDEASKKAGRDLSNSGKWVSKGANELALWGECKGSGSKPYQTQVDLISIAYKCSCPSRKFPCKHSLGLLLLHARESHEFKDQEAPAWVTDWLKKRTEKEEKQEEKKSKPVDEAAQAKRQQARQLKVVDGMAELNAWIKDIIRNGLLSVPDKGPAFFEHITRRMIDAQAPGLAGMVRSLAETNFYEEKWTDAFLARLLRIYLITEGFSRQDSLPEPLMQDIKSAIGFTQNQEELKAGAGVMDTWLVMGKQVVETDNITTEKFWFYGTNTHQSALILQFIVRGQGLQLSLSPGLFIQAELAFFPSSIPLRALIKRQIATEAVSVSSTFANWQNVAEKETEQNSLLPFRNENAYLVSKLKPIQHEGRYWLQDSENRIMLLTNNQAAIWKLFALSGGAALDMAVVGKGLQYEALGVWTEQEYKII